MATVYKVLGQLAPAAADANGMYTVPASTSSVVSTIIVANRSATADTFRISLTKSGDGEGTSPSFIAYETPIGGNDSTIISLGITLAAGDKIRVRSTNGTLSFNAFGTEIS